ncbi:hypothetical protein LI038_12470 [Clostridium perfringens]|uniref:hypothetical protein n=1 Tax=Clostridium perfringens TaxID=1502 RepID=UPI0022467450|nr:hypothetical protein [Clostridium perfringens]MCX0395223.1 hypothetical protein [Clostridium perfringens]
MYFFYLFLQQPDPFEHPHPFLEHPPWHPPFEEHPPQVPFAFLGHPPLLPQQLFLKPNSSNSSSLKYFSGNSFSPKL